MSSQTSTTGQQERSQGPETEGLSSGLVSPPAGLGRLLLLGLMSLGLCMLMPLAIFAPVPLCLAFLVFGKSRAWALGLGLFLPLAVLAFWGPAPEWRALGFEVGLMFALSQLSAVAISEVIFRKMPPSEGLLKSALTLIATGALGLGLLQTVGKVPISQRVRESVVAVAERVKQENQELLSAPGEEARELSALLDNPDLVLRWLPSALAAGIVVALWAVLFVILRNSLVWKRLHDYPYSVRDLLAFRVPEIMIWPLIAGLALYVGSDYGLGPQAEVWGGNLLYAMAPFFFFQGLGVYLDFLTYLRLGGLVRMLFVFGTVLMGWRYLVLLGVFDIWVGFRRFMTTSDKREQ